MMENVYVIKVKTKPPLSSLYPSERRYSASTVGGLSFVHFSLGALSLLLGTLALSLQGPILSVACLVPFVTGLLAWRRWYIDRNIAIFFYGSLFSLMAAALCFIATAFDIAAAAESNGSLWSVEKILDQHPNRSHLQEYCFKNDSSANDTLPLDSDTLNLGANSDQDSKTNMIDTYASVSGIILDNKPNISGYDLTTSISDLEEDGVLIPMNNSAIFEDNLQQDTNNFTDTSPAIDDEVISFWDKDRYSSSHSQILLTVNVLIASLLEFFWSALSVRIALRGMLNRLPESSYINGVNGAVSKSVGVAATKRKPPVPRPDILDHDHSLQNLQALHGLGNSAPRLPLPESSREFRERVERFLANQAAHRIIDGSCC